MELAKVTSKGQITIPLTIRKAMTAPVLTGAVTVILLISSIT